ncbi:CRISPR-associated protein Cmr3 [Paenibacillus cisolokensis]|uniref:CRISPR-associated protein Cmr3 n=1 Tax=Paenibacillus cisolokensis TaxID=1658519 RepID=A0ABQ4NFG6_9BACL|nr:type III-B CRISPR module-associated protein Cmr3 [Paenibacillus cisolokensis]GIQ66998.1 CRISPR-associated protein Cmr3 [Paenibacillus cisolokensis]
MPKPYWNGCTGLPNNLYLPLHWGKRGDRMSRHTLFIQPLEPLMLRDGRPFGATPGAEARSLDQITPGVLAGSLRTMLGKELHRSNVGDLQNSPIYRSDVRGPLYMWGERLFFPMPQDVEVYERKRADGSREVYVAGRRPCRPPEDRSKLGFLGTGTTGLHEERLWPVMTNASAKPFRPAPAFISKEWMIRWLCEEADEEQWTEAIQDWLNHRREPQSNRSPEKDSDHFREPFVRETRVHTSINAEKYVAQDQELYSTEYVTLPSDVSIVASIDTPDDCPWPEEVNGIHSFGGRRRLAYFQELYDQQEIWACPERILQVVDRHARTSETTYLRMVLTTPAYFSKGWIPGWLNEELKSADKDKFSKLFGVDLTLELVWACLPRWQPVSGWSYSARRAHRREKAVRRMAPAGSVYFLKLQMEVPRILYISSNAIGWLPSRMTTVAKTLF